MGGWGGWGVSLRQRGYEVRSSFLKKRSKKLLDGCRGSIRRRTPSGKSFLVLFFKKELLSFVS
jgi:hypothetical protein